MAQNRGRLFIIGGAEDKKGGCVILREFTRMSGGSEARIVVLPVASEHLASAKSIYLDVFRRLGVAEVQTIDINSREDANQEQTIKLIESATGVFFTGGDQVRITNLLGGTRADQILHQIY